MTSIYPPTIAHTSLAMSSMVFKILKVRDALLRKGLNQKSEARMLSLYDQMRILMMQKSARSLAEMCLLLHNKQDTLRELIPGGNNSAGRSMEQDLNLMVEFACRVNTFYKGDLNQVAFPFFLRHTKHEKVVKLCSPGCMVVVEQHVTEQRNIHRQQILPLSMDDYHELLLDSTWLPCDQNDFRALIVNSAQELLSMLDASARVTPRSTHDEDISILRQALS